MGDEWQWPSWWGPEGAWQASFATPMSTNPHAGSSSGPSASGAWCMSKGKGWGKGATLLWKEWF